jgi:uncharacterized membrane protein YgdD (TMEM256/DUF423 family)
MGSAGDSMIDARARGLLLAAALLGAAGVALGAFGAHGLRARLDARALEIWETAVRYHLLHAVALLALALSPQAPALRGPGWLFVAGIALFSGSLYALALGGPRALGPVTPLGGLAFLAGWLWLAKAALARG